MMNVGQLHLAPSEIVVVVQGRQVLMDRGDQIVVNRVRHVVVKQRARKRTFIAAGLGVVHIALHGAGERGGQRVFMPFVLGVVLMKGRFANGSLRRVQER